MLIYSIGCKNLKTINLTNKLKTVNKNAFNQTLNKLHVNFAGSRHEWEKIGGKNFVFSLKKYTIAYTLTSGKCGDNVTWKLNGSTLTISGKGRMYFYEFGESPWYNDYRIKNVVIEPGVTYIGAHSFEKCAKLNSVKIPETVTIIGTRAFRKSGITTIKLPQSLEYLPRGVFAESNITEIVIPDKVDTLDYGIFMYCVDLKKVTLSKKIPTITTEMFFKTGITSIVIPDSVTEIRDSAFKWCNSLKTVELSNSVKKIANNAFEGCSNLKKIKFKGTEAEWKKLSGKSLKLPKGCVIEYTLASGKCGKNLTWKLDGSTLTISGKGNMYDYKMSNRAPWYPNAKRIKNVVIESGVSGIGVYAFQNCAISSIKIPKTVTSIGSSAFTSSELTSIDIPDSVTSIGSYAFSGCNKLKSVELPNKIKTIKKCTFMQSTLESIVVPSSVTTIETQAFSGCYKLKTVTLSNTLKKIDKNAFMLAQKLTKIKFKGTKSQWKKIGGNSLVLPKKCVIEYNAK